MDAREGSSAIAGVLKGGSMIAGGFAILMAYPVTYIILVVQTWNDADPVAGKLLTSLTLDVLLAGLWPFTWAWWGIENALGYGTPLRSLFG